MFIRKNTFCVDFSLNERFFRIIYGNATAIPSNKSIVCRVWGIASINGWISRRKSCCKREFKDRTPALLCAVAVNTSTLTRAILKVQKLYVRPSFEYSTSGWARTRPRVLTHACTVPCAYTCAHMYTRTTRRFMLLIFAYERRGRLRAYEKSFTLASISSRLTLFPAIRL